MNEISHLRSLLEKEKGLDVNSKLIDDWTALHLAANEGHAEIIDILIQYKANLEAETKMERRAIHIAALRGNIKVIQILVHNGANINPRVKFLSIF
jgi:ankyrin repeat protein